MSIRVVMTEASGNLPLEPDCTVARLLRANRDDPAMPDWAAEIRAAWRDRMRLRGRRVAIFSTGWGPGPMALITLHRSDR